MEAKEDKDDRDEEDEQDMSGEEDEPSEPTIVTLDDFDLTAINAFQDKRKKGTGILEKLALDMKPMPKEEDVVERAKTFQRNRKARLPWKPGQSYFTIPEANENVSSDEEEEAFSSLLNQHRDYVKAQPAIKSPTQTETFAEIGARGANFMKYGRHGKPHIKIVRVDATTGKLSYGTGSLALQDATDIVAGKNTKVFEGVKHKYAHPSVCFSIILRNRTLDLRATNEEERDRWLKGLKALKKELDSKADEDSPDEEDEKARRNEEVSLLRLAHDTAVAFRAIATAGVPVKKYTRHGAAHERVLKLNFNTGTLDWQTGTISLLNVSAINPGTASSKHPAGTPGGDKCFSISSPGRTVDFKVASLLSRNMWISGLLEVLANTQQQVRSRSESESSTVKLFGECAVEGTPLLKYGKHGAPKKKLVKVDLNTGNVSWGTGFLNLADASAIVPADATQRTSLMNSIKRQNPKHGFSIIMANRQVDLEANSETERDLWVQGLKNLHRKLELETGVDLKLDDDDDDSVHAKAPSEQLRHGKIGEKPKSPHYLVKKPVAPTKRRKKSLILAVTTLEKQVQNLQQEQKRIQYHNKSLEDHVSQLHTKYGLPPFVITPISPLSSPTSLSSKLSAAIPASPPIHSPLERQQHVHPAHDRVSDRKAPPPPPTSVAPAHLSLHIPETNVSPAVLISDAES